MKQLILILLVVFYFFKLAHTQVYKTVNVTAGGLSSALTEEEKGSVTDLTVSGIIDARDFKTMRDEILQLKNLDLSLVTISKIAGIGITASVYHGYVLYPANEIAEYAFFNSIEGSHNPNLQSIILPSSVNAIGEAAFAYCPLTSIKFPPNVSRIGEFAFGGCGLTSVIIPSTVKTVESAAFSGCSGLTSVEIHEGVTTIDNCTFCFCSNLKSVTIPSTVINFGPQVFGDCTSLISVTFLSPITSIGDYTFGNCASLVSVNIPPSVKSIGYWAFRNCTSLTKLTLPISVTSISEEAFSGCSGLVNIYTLGTIPADLNASSNVFLNVDKATCTLYIPAGCKNTYQAANQWGDFIHIKDFFLINSEIDFDCTANAFAKEQLYCGGLWTISVDQTWLSINPLYGDGNNELVFKADSNPSSTIRTATITITSARSESQIITVNQAAKPKTADITAGNLAIALTPAELNGITTLTLSGTIDARDFKIMRDSMPLLTNLDISNTYIATYTGTLGTDGTKTNYYPENTLPTNAFYSFSTLMGKKSLKSIALPTSITNIGNSAFSGCSSLSAINIPETVKSIGNSAFEGCSELNTFIIPTQVMSIGDKTFAGCTGLSSINLPSFVTNIGVAAFSGCNSLISLDLPESVTNIGSSAFEGCSKLNTFIIPTQVMSIGDKTFAGCTGLLSISLPSFVTNIGVAAFSGCNSLNSLDLPESVTNIGSSAFEGCSKLNTFIIPSQVVSIGDYTFAGCTGLSSINLPSFVTNIGVAAFSGCNSLISLDLPEFVTNIGSSAFEGCSGLTSINIPPLVTIIESYTFSGCHGLTSVNIPETVTSIGNSAFEGCSELNTFIIPPQVTSIGDKTFAGCIRLSSINLPTSVSKIGSNIFAGCIKLNSIIIPSSITALEFGTFYACSSLTNVSIPSSVSMIGDYAFARCKALSNISIPSSVTYIGRDAFTDCALISVSIPNLISYISSGTFLSCKNLISVSIPSSVTFLAGEAFSFCSALDTIYCFGSDPPICFWENFENVNKTTCKLYVPYGTKEAYSQAVGWKDFTNIIEMPGFKLSASSVDFPHEQSTIPINIASVINWTASSDESWLKVDPLTGIGNIAVNLTAETNNAFSPRTAKITVSAAGVSSQLIAVTQQANFINHAPVANAGLDQTVRQGTTVTLNGSSSSDPDGNTVTFMWSAPAGITLSSTTVSNPTFIAPNVSGNTNYIFSLIVNDGNVNSTPDQVTIKVFNNLAPSAPTFINPVDNETKDATIPVFFNWDAANDPEHDVLGYKLHIWSNNWDTIIDCGVSLYCNLPSDILEGHTNYNCIVTAWDGKTGTASNIIRFSTINHPPAVPQLFHPTNNSILDAHSPIDFFWLRTPDIDRDNLTYDLHIIGTAKDTVITNVSNNPYILPSFILSPEGSYRFWITANDGLTETKSPEVICYTYSYTTIEEVNNKNGLVVYPNPSNGLITFIYRNTDNTRLQELDLYNSMGVHVKSLLKGRNDTEINQQFNLQSLPNGLYSVVVKTQNRQYILKLSKIE